MTKIIRLFNTVKYLKIKQIYFRLFYLIRNKYRAKIGFKYPLFFNIKAQKLILEKSIPSNTSYKGEKNFTFLNLSQEFNNIDWNHNTFGKLWTYNITYFEFLNQEKIDTNDAKLLIYDFIEKDSKIKDGLEPFPISLRGINWIKFLVNHNVIDEKIDNALYRYYIILIDTLEYHLLGNHLLENAFSLLFAAYYFEDEDFYFKAKELLLTELEEQILCDGAHFELSPMYHQLMLFRLLDCINLVKNNSFKNKELLDFLNIKASFMLNWLNNITYRNGNIPLLNDSTNNIAPKSSEIFDYASNLKLNYKFIGLGKSGYRKVENKNYECIVDIGAIGPDYIPGHAHSDTFSFELYLHEKPFIVDTGLSTYEMNSRRTCERETLSHNTIQVNGNDQSEIWGSFRVANRAKVTEVFELGNTIRATHDGYKGDNIYHTRQWQFEDCKIIISDTLNKDSNAISMLHFHPSIKEEEILRNIKIGEAEFKLLKYDYSPSFNQRIEAISMEIKFTKILKIEILI